VENIQVDEKAKTIRANGQVTFKQVARAIIASASAHGRTPTVTPRFCSPYSLHYARLAAIVERAHAYLEGAQS
jgi:hypothetical protein